MGKLNVELRAIIKANGSSLDGAKSSKSKCRH